MSTASLPHVVEHGDYDGDPCNRDGCTGTITQKADPDWKCTRCFPPESCVHEITYCPTCGWSDS